MKLTKTKLKQLIKEELKALRNEGAYEDDPSFQHEVDAEYGDMSHGDPGDLTQKVDVKDIPKYLEDMGYMIVPIEHMQMSPDQAGDYETAAAKTDAWDMTKGGTGDFSGGMARRMQYMQKESKRKRAIKGTKRKSK